MASDVYSRDTGVIVERKCWRCGASPVPDSQGGRVVSCAAELAAVFERFGFRYTTATELVSGIATVLLGRAIAFRRDVELTREDRIAFLVGDVGVYVALSGGLADVVRQCARFLSQQSVGELLVICGSERLAAQMPKSLCGKPIVAISARAGGGVW